MAELVDARDLKSLVPQGTCRFDSGPPHQVQLGLADSRHFKRGYVNRVTASSGGRAYQGFNRLGHVLGPEVGIPHRGLDALVAHEFLNRSEVSPSQYQAAGASAPQAMPSEIRVSAASHTLGNHPSGGSPGNTRVERAASRS